MEVKKLVNLFFYSLYSIFKINVIFWRPVTTLHSGQENGSTKLDIVGRGLNLAMFLHRNLNKVGVQFIEPARKAGLINQTPTLWGLEVILPTIFIILGSVGNISLIYGLDVLDNVSVISRSLAGTFYPGDVTSVVYNPAGAPLIKDAQVTASYLLLYDNARYNTISYANRFNEYSVAVTFAQMYRTGVPILGSLAEEPVTTSVNHVGSIISLAREIAEFNVGLSFKTYYVDMYTYKSPVAYGIDAGTYRNLFWQNNLPKRLVSVNAGVVVYNLITPVLIFKETSEITGLDYRVMVVANTIFLPPDERRKAALSYDEIGVFLDYTSSGYGLGVEYRWEKYFMRIGYTPRYANKFTAGFGVMFDEFSLNYGWTTVADFNVHSIEAVYRFKTFKK